MNHFLKNIKIIKTSLSEPGPQEKLLSTIFFEPLPQKIVKVYCKIENVYCIFHLVKDTSDITWKILWRKFTNCEFKKSLDYNEVTDDTRKFMYLIDNYKNEILNFLLSHDLVKLRVFF